jgi:hypothetical protein
MSHDAWIGQVRMLALENMIVRTTDTDVTDVKQDPAKWRSARGGAVQKDQLTRRVADKRFHAEVHCYGTLLTIMNAQNHRCDGDGKPVALKIKQPGDQKATGLLIVIRSL